MISWEEIHVLEVSEDYPAAIDALEERLQANPSDPEAVIRLGFNLWYAVVENARMGKNLPVESYRLRFIALLDRYKHVLSDNADFCWAYGLGISLFWREFPGTTQKMGDDLLAQARSLDSFWAADLIRGDYGNRFTGRGIFASYYVVE